VKCKYRDNENLLKYSEMKWNDEDRGKWRKENVKWPKKTNEKINNEENKRWQYEQWKYSEMKIFDNDNNIMKIYEMK